VPLYFAHAHLDHARVAAVMGDTSGSARSLDRATELYRSLGATAYLSHVNTLRSETASIESTPIFGLSDRERDVVTLLTSGMSYVQIARALFITRSTVSYHLVNVYAKTNVGSRHELTQLAHENPTALGLAAPA